MIEKPSLKLGFSIISPTRLGAIARRKGAILVAAQVAAQSPHIPNPKMPFGSISVEHLHPFTEGAIA
jgi:hypothetical protein